MNNQIEPIDSEDSVGIDLHELIGLFRSNIKIISKEKMRKLKPKYLLVLIWSFRKEVILQEEKFIKNGGKLIFHLPMFYIVDKNNYRSFINNNFESLSYNF